MTQVNITYTTQELVELLEVSQQAISARAKREGWQSQPRPGRGGGKLWIVQSMPESTRDQISASITQRMQAEQPESLRAPRVPELPAVLPVNLATWQREIMNSRLIILAEVQRIAVIDGIIKAEKRFAKMAKTGELSPYYQELIAKANARQGKKRSLSVSTLRNWRRANANEGPTALAPKVAQVPVEKAYPAWLLPFLEEYRLPGKPSINDIHRRLKGRLNLPSVRTVERRIAGLSKVEQNRGRISPKELKKYQAFVRRDTKDLLPTDIYSADGTVADMYAIKPENGTLFRPEITTVIDVKTRVLVGFSIGLAENALDVTAAIRMACQKFGIPAILYTDNGPGYKNKHLEDELLGVLARLGISPTHSIPRSSQSRGIIENLQKLWNREARTHKCFCGKDMDKDALEKFQKQAKLEFKRDGNITCAPTLPQFAEIIQRCADEYNTTPHSSLPKIYDPETGVKRHMTPLEYWAKLASKSEFFMPQDWELEDMLRPQIDRVCRRGELRVFNMRYFNKELERLHGERLAIGIDIHNPDQVQVREMTGQLICYAKLDGNVSAFMRRSFVDMKRDQRAARRLKRQNEKIIEIESERRGIAGELTAGPVVQKLNMTPEQEAIQAELLAEVSPQQPPVQRAEVIDITPVTPATANDTLIPDDPDEKFKLARELEDKISKGIEIDTKLAIWLGGFQQSPEYKARVQMEELHAQIANQKEN